jgi:Tfp pilus assembly protein PilV
MHRRCTKLRAGFQPPAGRLGITLLEVMIAMGVLAVGIMSIASLLPVGRYQMSQAVVFDEASALGRAAFRDMQVHGYLRPATWLYVGPPLQAVTNGPLMTAPPGTGRTATGSPGSIGGFQQTPPAMPMVLDPLMVAMNVVPTVGTNFTGANITTQRAVATFPYFLQSGSFTGGSPESTAPQIPRITLRDAPINCTIQSTIRAIPQGVADRFFRSTDDVAFVVPNMGLAGGLATNTQNTSIEFIGIANSADTASTLLTRASRGDYTFFAVLSPDFSETWGAPGGYPYGSTGSGGYYNMLQGNASSNRLFNIAVVVCYQRDLRTLTNFVPSTTYDRGERMVWVDFLNRGDVRLRVSGVSQQAQAQQLLDVKSNQWIMVTGQQTSFLPLPLLGGSFASAAQKGWTQTVAKWYRVLSVASQATQDLGSTTTWYRAARVVGPDWTINGASDGNLANMIYTDANPFSYADLSGAQMPNPPTGWGTIVSGAIAVYEKTINLDDSSSFVY